MCNKMMQCVYYDKSPRQRNQQPPPSPQRDTSPMRRERKLTFTDVEPSGGMELEEFVVTVETEKTLNFWKKYRGIILAVCCGFLCTINAALVKGLTKRSATDLAFFCYLSNSVFTLPSFTLCRNLRLDRVGMGLLLFSVVCSTISNQLRYTAFKILPIGDASAILFNTPVFVAILARVFLKERIGRTIAVSICISVVGLCLVAKLPLTISDAINGRGGSGGVQHAIGCAYAFGSVATYSVVSVIIRKMRRTSEWAVAFVRSFFNAIFMSMLAPAFSDKPFATIVGECGPESIVFLIYGLLSPVYAVVYTAAMKYEQASVVCIIAMSIQIFTSFFVQVCLFKDALNAYNTSGATLVFVAGLIIALRKWIVHKPVDSEWRRKLKWIEN